MSVCQEASGEGPAPPLPPPNQWAAEAADEQDRWTITIPGTTLQQRQIDEYRRQHGALPPQGWTGCPPPRYVRVTATLPGGRHRRSVLKSHVAPGGGRQVASLAPAVFGREVTDVSLEPATLTGYRLARISTPNARLKLIAVVLGVVSAGIAASFAIGDKMAHPHLVSSGTAFTMKIVAAALAALAPFAAVLSDVWFRETDVPD